MCDILYAGVVAVLACCALLWRDSAQLRRELRQHGNELRYMSRQVSEVSAEYSQNTAPPCKSLPLTVCRALTYLPAGGETALLDNPQ